MLKFVFMNNLKKYYNGGVYGGPYGSELGEFESGSYTIPDQYQSSSEYTIPYSPPYGGSSSYGKYNPKASIVSGAGTAFGGIGGLFGTGRKAQQRERDLATAAAQDIEKFYEKAAAGQYDFTLDPAYAELYELSKTKTSTDPLTRASATAFSALESAGERATLAGINPLTQSIAQQEVQLGLTDLQREMSGIQSLGAARQGITQANQQFMRDLGMRQLGQAELAQAQAQQNIRDMKAARANALGSILGGAAQAGTAYALLKNMAKDGMKVPKYKVGGEFPDHSGDGKITQKDILMEKGVIPMPRKAEYGMKYAMGGNVLAQIMGGEGDLPPVQGPIPGEASHETNPIHMINNDGEKVGEAMGGEFIINDKQADLISEDYKAIEKAIEDGREPTKDELMALYESCKQVFGQPQFEDEEEVEMQMA